MSSADGILAALGWNWRMVDGTLADLDEAALARQPQPQCNSIAWTLWHMNRVVDMFVHERIASDAPLWLSDGWCEKYGMSDSPEDRGAGWTAEQVAAWTPPAKDVQMGYYEAVKEAGRSRISGLSEEELAHRRVIPPMREPRSVAQALGQMTWDNVSHGGQISYIRGLFDGMGWYGR
jgi:hypothetical protein